MNYYDVLRVNKNASSQEIKDSYKKLIKRYHPDLYPGNKKKAESITRDLNEAYEVLSDPDKKSIYDYNLEEENLKYAQHYKTSQEYKNNTYYNTQNTYAEQKSPTWEEKLKANIYNFVDEKTQKMTAQTKQKIVFVILFIALIILLITAADYINFRNSIIVKHQDENIEDMEDIEYIYDIENIIGNSTKINKK